MAATGTRAGHLIRAGAVGTCLKCWHDHGRTGAAWQKARLVLRELFPSAKTNSIEAVIRIAQGAAATAREQQRKPDDWVPTRVVDARRLIRDAHRE